MTARDLIRNAVRSLAIEAGAQMVERPVLRGEPGGHTRPEPEPLAGITAASALAAAARGAIRDHARYAREDGLAWSQIGEALGQGDDPEAAFLRVAADLGRGPSFAWTCPACQATVIDRGPEYGPLDAETGHADGCGRLAEAVRAWEGERDEH